MIRRCHDSDFDRIYGLINDSARAYEGIIPDDCYKDPYMSRSELEFEIDQGVQFWCLEESEELLGVMGLQQMEDVTLIRHSYVLSSRRLEGVGGRLLSFLLKRSKGPILVGTWEDVGWAISFYEKFGFKLVSKIEKERLLRRYWSISDRQIEKSVVLADNEWFRLTGS